jgi:hypothetical protein
MIVGFFAPPLSCSAEHERRRVKTPKDKIFCGLFQVEYESTVPSMPEFCMNMYGLGTFEVTLDRR